MGSFKLGKMTLHSMVTKPETSLYPLVEPTPPAQSKGKIVNDIDACIFCSICAKRCPTGALLVDKPSKLWSIDRLSCIQCGYCVRECPKNCLRMDSARVSVRQELGRDDFNQLPTEKESGSEGE